MEPFPCSVGDSEVPLGHVRSERSSALDSIITDLHAIRVDLQSKVLQLEFITAKMSEPERLSRSSSPINGSPVHRVHSAPHFCEVSPHIDFDGAADKKVRFVKAKTKVRSTVDSLLEQSRKQEAHTRTKLDSPQLKHSSSSITGSMSNGTHKIVRKSAVSQEVAAGIMSEAKRTSGHQRMARQSTSSTGDIVRAGWCSSTKQLASSLFRRLASEFFTESFMGAVIVFNIASTAISCDVERDWVGWHVIDACFATIFVCESSLKLASLGFRSFLFGIGRGWRVFEAFIAALATLEVLVAFVDLSSSNATLWPMFLRLIRIVRVLRLARLGRLPIFRNLMIMIDGALGGARTLLWAIVLVGIMVLTVALILREGLGALSDLDESAESFLTLSQAFFMVFRAFISGDDADHTGRPVFLRVANRYGWGWGVLYCFMVMCFSFGLFNVIVAIFVDNVLSHAKRNEAISLRSRLQDKGFFMQKMAEVVALVWQTCPHVAEKVGLHRLSGSDHSTLSAGGLFEAALGMEIGVADFDELLRSEEFGILLRELDVSDEDQFYLFHTLDADGSGTIDMGEMLDGISKLRGTARRSDIVSLALTMDAMQAQLHNAALTTELFAESINYLVYICDTSERRIGDDSRSPWSSESGPRRRNSAPDQISPGVGILGAQPPLARLEVDVLLPTPPSPPPTSRLPTLETPLAAVAGRTRPTVRQ